MSKWKNNLGLKALAFLFAFLLWLIVVNVDNPVITKTFNGISVEVEHSEILTERQKTFQIVDDTQTVNVTVTAKRRVLSSIKQSDIKVKADFKEMYLDSQIPLEVIIEGYEGEYDSAFTNPRNLQIQIEENVSKTPYITPVAVGEVRDGYVLGSLKANPETVTINGPESIINKIYKVVAEVDVSGLSENTTKSAELVFYDEEGSVIDQSRLGNNLGNIGVNIDISLYKTKMVPIHVDTSGVAVKQGYSISAVKIAPEEIEVAGPDEVLEHVESIEIPKEELQGETVESKTDYTIDLGPYLPDNIQLADKMADSLVVTISIEKNGTKNFELPVGSITVKNLNESLRMQYESTSNLEVAIEGEQEVLSTLDIERLATINLKEYKKAGTYTIPVIIELPETCKLEKEIQVNIILENK